MANEIQVSKNKLAVAPGSSLDANQRAALEKLKSLLTDGEAIEHHAFQQRIHALTRRRAAVVATDRRIIFFQRGLFGGFNMQDIQWQDVKNAHIKERLLPLLMGADLTISTHDGRTFAIRGARSDVVRKIYACAQQQEQGWREKRRIREMEEARAKSGGVTIGGAAGLLGGALGQAGPQSNVNADEVMKKLKDAKALLDQGAISDAEYETLKARLMNSLG